MSRVLPGNAFSPEMSPWHSEATEGDITLSPGVGHRPYSQGSLGIGVRPHSQASQFGSVVQQLIYESPTDVSSDLLHHSHDLKEIVEDDSEWAAKVLQRLAKESSGLPGKFTMAKFDVSGDLRAKDVATALGMPFLSGRSNSWPSEEHSSPGRSLSSAGTGHAGRFLAYERGLARGTPPSPPAPSSDRSGGGSMRSEADIPFRQVPACGLRPPSRSSVSSANASAAVRNRSSVPGLDMSRVQMGDDDDEEVTGKDSLECAASSAPTGSYSPALPFDVPRLNMAAVHVQSVPVSTVPGGAKHVKVFTEPVPPALVPEYSLQERPPCRGTDIGDKGLDGNCSRLPRRGNAPASGEDGYPGLDRASSAHFWPSAETPTLGLQLRPNPSRGVVITSSGTGLKPVPAVIARVRLPPMGNRKGNAAGGRDGRHLPLVSHLHSHLHHHYHVFHSSPGSDHAVISDI